MGSLLLLFVLVWFGNLEYRTLIRPDEGRYAEIPREMVATGDWITPRLNGLKYFEKPVLQYWATAAAYTLFGEHNWTARLWPALTGFAGVFLVWLAGRRLWNENAGRYTALVAGSSLLYVFIGHVNTLDMGLTFFMSLSLCGFLLAQRDDATPQENRFWMYAAWAGAAGAMLSKGLIALVLPGAVLVLYILLQRDWGMLKRLHLVSGTLLFLALAAPWFVAVSLKNPEFFNFFFIHEHFNRFLTKVHARYQPWWYFVPILLAGILPWLFHLGETLLGAWRNEPSKKFQPRRFLLIWAVFIFLFFSRSDSKLPSYILPIFPALALLMGERFSRIGGRRLLWLTAPLLPLALAAMLLAPRAVSMADADAPLALYQNYVPWLVAAGAVFAVGVIAAMVLSRREAIGPALASIAFSGLLASQLVLTGHEELAPAHSSYLLAEKVKPYLKPDTPFYSVYFYEQTLPFLIKRPVTVVEFLDELEFGIRQEPDKWLALERDFLEVWKTLPYGLAIMKLETYAKFVEWKVPMVLIAKDNRAAIVRTP